MKVIPNSQSSSKVYNFLTIWFPKNGAIFEWILLLGYIDHELNFNDEGTCTNTCEDYTNTKHIRCESNTLCAQNRNPDVPVCAGDVRDCKELSDDDVHVCFGDTEQRRYHSLKYEDGTQYGQEPSTNCASKNYVNCFFLLLLFHTNKAADWMNYKI